MPQIQLIRKVGADGVLTLSVPVGVKAANRDVTVTVDIPEEASSMLPPEEWKRRVQEMAGSIPDPTFRRWEQGEFEDRDEIFS